MKNPISDKKLADLSGWDIARELGCDYTGDMNPVMHGGVFYDSRDWESYDYASCVEFWEDPETHHLCVTRGTINRSQNMERAFHCCGIPKEEQDNIHAQIETSRSYSGIESDDTRTFDLESLGEYEIWKAVRSWLEELSDPERVASVVRKRIANEVGLSPEAPDYAISDAREEMGLPRIW